MDTKRISVQNEREIMRKAQRARAVTQETLANKIGVKRNALCQNMNRSRMSLSTFADVLNAMEYDIVIVDRSTGEPAWKLFIPTRDPEVEDDDI